MTAAALDEQQACRHQAGLSDGWLTSGIVAITAAFLTSIAPVPDAPAAAARPVDGTALISAADDLQDWLTHGRTYDEQRFSPLDRINAANVKDLGLAWFADLDTARGQEATPLVIDGTVYITTAWSKVRSEEHTSELQSHSDLVCRLLLEKKKRRSTKCSSLTNRGSSLITD